MPPDDPAPDRSRSLAGRFQTTPRSLVLLAKDRGTPEAKAALAALCTTYWYPLYAYIHRRVHDPERAQDLTQEFFARLLESDALASVDRRKGRFRSFLLVACTHFLANRRDHDRAGKRGGRVPIPIDRLEAEGRYVRELVDTSTAERLFERRWALALLERVVGRLEAEMAGAGKAELFTRLKGALTGERDAGRYGAIARELGTTEGAIKMAASRLRRRYQEILREEIGRTVDDPAEVDDEIRTLFAALGH
jgi:DNA-directed RNA polymerase specialized sigma24 family protein